MRRVTLEEVPHGDGMQGSCGREGPAGMPHTECTVWCGGLSEEPVSHPVSDPLQQRARGHLLAPGLSSHSAPPSAPTHSPTYPPIGSFHSHSPRTFPQLHPWLPLLTVQVSAQTSPERGLPEPSYLK